MGVRMIAHMVVAHRGDHMVVRMVAQRGVRMVGHSKVVAGHIPWRLHCYFHRLLPPLLVKK